MPTLKIIGDQSLALEGIAPANATLEAIDLTSAAQNRMATDEFAAVGKADSSGKFSLPLTGYNVGDYVRLRAKGADGKVKGTVTVRIAAAGKTDTNNAPLMVRRLAIYDAGSGGKAVVTQDDTKRPVSEPFAKIQIKNTRTNALSTVTLDKDGNFPKNSTILAKPGDLIELSVSDGTNDPQLQQKAASYTVVGKIPHANDVPDPDAHHDQKDKQGRLKVGMKLFTGPLFANGATPGDVGQQYIADCYLPAAIGALAKARPDVIAKMITDNGDGSYTVVWKEWSAQKQKYVDKPVKVDADLYVDGEGQPIYGAGLPVPSPAGPTMELWFPLIEKAYAQYMGSYEAIGNGGSPADVLSAALGRDPFTRSVSSATQTWQLVTNAVDNKVASAFCTSKDEKKYENTGIHEDHCYSILDYRTGAGGKREVLLRNPWGYDEPGNDGNDDGVFWYPIEDCVKMFTDFFSVT